MTDFYTRQEDLNVEAPESVTVIGVGGIGSWTALNVAMAGAETVYVVDPDDIEDHNLNRTPFKIEQIGEPKVTALTELIAERRPDTEVIPITSRVEDASNAFIESMKDSVILDCRDHAEELPEGMEPLATAGYDGLEYTLHVKPDYTAIFGENTEYETVPSFIAPPQLLSSLLTVIACTELSEELDTAVGSGDIPGLINQMLPSGPESEEKAEESDTGEDHE